LRGRILTVLDLRKLFDLPPRGLTELNRVILLRGQDTELGLLADSIGGVRQVVVSELQRSLSGLSGLRERFVQGITAQMLVVLDGARLLSDDSLKVNDETQVRRRT